MKKIIIILCLISLLFSDLQSQSYPTDSMDVHHYNIELDLVHLSKKELDGHARIRFSAQSGQQKNFYFDLLELTVDSVRVEGQHKTFTSNDTLIKIPVDSTVNLADTLTADIYYGGHPVVEAANWGGFHFLSDSSLAYNLGIAFQAEPHNYGRVWFPCVDNFTDRATYEFHIRTKGSHKAVCTGIQDSLTQHSNGNKTWHWSINQTLPTYLASVAVSDFSVIEDSYQGIERTIPTTLYVSPSDSADAQGSFVHLNAILSTYEQAYGPYRWPRVGYVGTVKGAMEHVTSIAYPRHCIDGTLNCESLLAHELSHAWFGNLVTCKTAKDMWMNEGWAVFSEAIYKEGLYGTSAYKDYMRDKLHEVVQTAHITDNGYRALYGIPSEYTYGATVYDKGATVVHSLRHYLGDSLFFPVVRSYLDSFAFHHASTQTMNQFINQASGVNVNAFFDAWVYRPGFSHFSVDSFRYISGLAQFNTEVYLKQRLVGTSQYASDNKLQLGILMDNQNIEYRTVEFSGQDTTFLFNFPDKPAAIMIDPGEQLSDATTDQYKTLRSNSTYDYEHTYASVDVQDIQDSVLVRITHNWIGPEDSTNIQPALYHLSNNRYWQVEGTFPASFHAKAAFTYQKYGNLDEDLIVSLFDSLSILYKEKQADPWEPISCTQDGSPYAGKIIVDTLRKGFYVLARYDKSLGSTLENNDTQLFEIMPNPTRNNIRVVKKYKHAAQLALYNNQGQLLQTKTMGEDHIQLNLTGLGTGLYYLHIYNEKYGFKVIKTIMIQP
ncbi:MAG: M1 family aminopeptidase [Bacteroidales bacterium]